MKGLQPSGIRRRNKMIYAAVVLFLENGYEKTTTAQIARRAGMSATSFFAAFPNKEAILYALVREMFAEQFKWTERLLGERPDPLLLYCAETALQIHITELSPELRELYMTAYSLQSTSEYIYQNISKKLETFFAPYLPGAQASDFYELEIASAGVMRGFMGRPCDLYFTIERKLRRFLSCCMRLYCVPEEKQEQVIARVLQMDLRTQAQEIVGEAVRRAEAGFEAVMADRPEGSLCRGGSAFHTWKGWGKPRKGHQGRRTACAAALVRSLPALPDGLGALKEPAPQPRPRDVQQHESQPDRDGKERHDLHRIPDYAAAHEPAAAEGVRLQPPEKRRQHRRDAEIAQHMRALRRAPIQRPPQLADGTLHRAGFVIHLPHSYERARPCIFRPERNHGKVLLCMSCGAIVAQAGAASF